MSCQELGQSLMNVCINPLIQLLNAILFVHNILDQLVDRVIIGLDLVLDNSEVLVPVIVVTLLTASVWRD